ncbi:uncharacterized protein LOC122091454 isoform X2 [Macadamia integrifolia]|uniref:uncharacterized protein LOC122091454 isoform X2 n=1 Tax=Macadamia integrifolia TaxID=60698 RepID=UPI001C4E6CD3|nr:uncharacterized protein LOC122091454 isoform X2 [Macadamia integrifolia]
MISSKVVITYRRKRTSSRLEHACGTPCIRSNSESPSGNLVTSLGHHDETRKEYLPENQKGDARHCIKCFDLGGNLLHCGGCSQVYHLQCTDPPLKLVTHDQWLCTTCIQQKCSRKSLELQVPESGRKVARSVLTDKVLLAANHGEDSSDKETESSLLADACSNSGSTCKNAFPETRSVSQFEDMETELKAKSSCIDSSLERYCGSGCPCACMPKTFDMENPDSLSNDKSCGDALLKKKCSSPLITFCRRAKKKKDVNRPDTENNSVVEERRYTAINYCSSASEIGSKHEAPSECISVGQLTDVISSRQEPDTGHVQDEIVNEEVAPSATCTSADCQKDLPIKCAAISSAIMDLDVNEDKQCKLTEVGVSVGEEFQCVENGGSKGAVKPGAVLGIRASVVHLDLSVAPPVNGTCSELNINASPGNFLDVPSSASPNHATILHEERTNKGKVPVLLETSNEPVQERPSSDTHADRNSCIKTKEHGSNSKDCGKAPTSLPTDISSQNLCQQNFSEDFRNEMPCRPSEATACVVSSLTKSGCKDDHYSQMSTESFLCSPLFLGLSLPMEPETAVSASKDCSSMSSFPSSSKSEDIQNLLPHSAPHQSSIQRHKLMLDSIVTRAKALKGNQGCWLDKSKGSATAWSEEELDSLWIGVRRHGRGNWDAMLRDPRLHFSVWRVAKDLAEQWDDEQSQLLSGMMIQPARFRNSQDHPQCINSDLWSETRMAGNGYASYHMGNCMPPRSQALIDETQLSLGNVYVQTERRYPYSLPSQYAMHNTLAENSPDKVSSVLNSDLRNAVLQRISNKQLQKSIRGQRNRTYPKRKRPRYRTDISIFEQNAIDKSVSYDGLQNGELSSCGEVRATSHNSFLPDHPPPGSSVKSNLPHWLREVISLPPPRPTESAMTYPVSQASLLYNEHRRVTLTPPFCSSGELPLPQTNPHQGLRKNDINGMFGGRETSDIPLSCIGSRFGHLSVTGSSSAMVEAENQILNGRTDLNPACSYPIGKAKDLIVIESDASSEETISDDQSGRP